MASIAATTVRPARRVKGTVGLAGDKSISHRYALLAALATGRTTIHQYSLGADCAATLDCLESAGVEIRRSRSPERGLTVEIAGRGLRGLRAPAAPLDAQNSGTTMRLLSGVLAAHPFHVGGHRRCVAHQAPMGRVIVPLELMGARIESHDKKPPLTIHGAALKGIRYRTEVPSAQVKSAILLAGLQAEGTTVVEESAATRNHTELALRAFGATVDVDGNTIEVAGGQTLHGGEFVVSRRHLVGGVLACGRRRDSRLRCRDSQRRPESHPNGAARRASPGRRGRGRGTSSARPAASRRGASASAMARLVR